MTESEDAEFARQMDKGIKRWVIWYHTQDFSQMNEQARGELESLFSNGEKFDPMAGMQIITNMMMFGAVLQDGRFVSFAARAAQASSPVPSCRFSDE
ncbi:hypothetical protein WKH08_23745 [Pantoea agglomerans]|uniref:Uncharacterized protein n=1 Tax=Enterobacter agglomerans TaxID=549 RepID=A0ABD6XK87_ENTAG|nr:hypothetical protein [Pantoea agglomerans]AOE42597.1 hypothetical protein BEE12_22665 [Pantoea agglomerans]MDQ0627613.1 hypothetical protein [Pantoea agglomerans]NKE96711.1 hypothetical protein [Pantoea agglomerans]TRO70066.1 hypothetical protein E5140_21490 [Pantoea agglomerans]